VKTYKKRINIGKTGQMVILHSEKLRSKVTWRAAGAGIFTENARDFHAAFTGFVSSLFYNALRTEKLGEDDCEWLNWKTIFPKKIKTNPKILRPCWSVS
jgi:hypothetical protein